MGHWVMTSPSSSNGGKRNWGVCGLAFYRQHGSYCGVSLSWTIPFNLDGMFPEELVASCCVAPWGEGAAGGSLIALEACASISMWCIVCVHSEFGVEVKIEGSLLWPLMVLFTLKSGMALFTSLNCRLMQDMRPPRQGFSEVDQWGMHECFIIPKFGLHCKMLCYVWCFLVISLSKRTWDGPESHLPWYAPSSMYNCAQTCLGNMP